MFLQILPVKEIGNSRSRVRVSALSYQEIQIHVWKYDDDSCERERGKESEGMRETERV